MSLDQIIPLDIDLSDFSQWLRLQGVAHRIVEEHGGQVLLLADERYQDQVSRALNKYLSDPASHVHLQRELVELQKKAQRSRRPRMSVVLSAYPRANPWQAPVIYLLMGLSIIIALLTNFGDGGPLLRQFLIIDPLQTQIDLSSVSGRWNAMIEVLIRGDFWRLVSPDFLHFSGMHITFNCLMLWVLGGQLEIQKGSLSFLALVFFVSVVSNIAQLLETSYLFGGMSGVVYGLVGYCWLWRYFDKSIFFPSILLKFSLFWLLLGYTPVTEWLGLGKMANAAHLYGLLAGLCWAGISLYVNEVLLKNRQ